MNQLAYNTSQLYFCQPPTQKIFSRVITPFLPKICLKILKSQKKILKSARIFFRKKRGCALKGVGNREKGIGI